MKTFKEFLKEYDDSKNSLKFGVDPNDVLVESFIPKETQYTTIKIPGANLGIFVYEGLSYCVIVLADGEIGFSSSKSIGREESIRTIGDVFRIFRATPSNLNNAISIFNRIVYVMIDMLKSGPELIKFSGTTTKLDRLYSKMIEDKNIISSIEHLGYSYLGKIDDEFIFQK